jgi:hypothetical protein
MGSSYHARHHALRSINQLFVLLLAVLFNQHSLGSTRHTAVMPPQYEQLYSRLMSAHGRLSISREAKSAHEQTITPMQLSDRPLTILDLSAKYGASRQFYCCAATRSDCWIAGFGIAIRRLSRYCSAGASWVTSTTAS